MNNSRWLPDCLEKRFHLGHEPAGLIGAPLTSRGTFGIMRVVMQDLVQSSRMDKTALSVLSFGEAAADDRKFWLSKTPEERLAALELLRQIHYGYDPASIRLQRVLTVVELGEG